MIKIGSPGELTKVTAYLLKGSTKIPITSFNCSYSIGSIPTCSLGVPIEFISKLPTRADEDIYKVIVESNKDKYTLFAGYVAGPSGSVSARSVEAGINLVHPARDLDATRLTNPTQLTSGVNDWNYEIYGGGDGTDPEEDYYNPEKTDDPLPQQIINGIVTVMKTWQSESQENESTRNADGFITIVYTKSIALLEKIKVLNGALNKELGSLVDNEINKFVNKEITGSIESQTSLWNVLNSIMSQFGFQLLCDHNGDVLITTDLANFEPPDKNYFYSDQIWSLNQSSSFVRNVSQVNLLISNQRDENNDILVSYPDKIKEGEPFSGSMSVLLPSWLEELNEEADISTQGSSAVPQEPPSACSPPPVLTDKKPTADQETAKRNLQLKYAKSVYYSEKNKWSTISFSGPLLPNAVPGTTIWVQPYSAVKAMSGVEIGDGSLFSGHLVEVQHSLSASGQSVQTSLVLKNVSRSDEDFNIKEHFLFSDVTPFVLE